MSGNSHPLLTKRMGGALAVIALTTSVALSLMSFGLFPVGMVLSILGAIGAAWIYWSDLRQLRLRNVRPDGVAAPLYSEIWVILLAIVIAVGAPGYVYVRSIIPVVLPDKSRHLTNDQKERMAPFLKLVSTENYWIEINSVPNCDECELYAEEFREFIGAIPGWRATGSAITLWDPNVSPYGLRLQSGDGQNSPEMQRKITKAFSAASISLSILPTVHYSDDLSGIVVVGRAPK